MSKYVKNLIADDLRERLDGVSEALLVSVEGVGAETTRLLRSELRAKDISLLVIKNSLARRATEGGPLATVFTDLAGPAAIVWGGEDIIGVAKAVTVLVKDKKFAPFQSRGGVMDGRRISAAEVDDVSRWPTRDEQLAILSAQITSVGARLAGQLTATASALASQIQMRAEQPEEPAEEAGG